MTAKALSVRAFTIVGAVAVWWFLTNIVWSANRVLSQVGPGDAIPAMWDIITTSDGIADIQASLGRLLFGLGLSFLIGVPLGVLFGTFKVVEDAATPIVNFFRMISPLAWAPLVIIAFGVGTAPVVFSSQSRQYGHSYSELRPEFVQFNQAGVRSPHH